MWKNKQINKLCFCTYSLFLVLSFQINCVFSFSQSPLCCLPDLLIYFVSCFGADLSLFLLIQTLKDSVVVESLSWQQVLQKLLSEVLIKKILSPKDLYILPIWKNRYTGNASFERTKDLWWNWGSNMQSLCTLFFFVPGKIASFPLSWKVSVLLFVTVGYVHFLYFDYEFEN